MDISVYAAWGFTPADAETVRTRLPVIEFTIWDSISGLNESTFEITIDGTNIFGLDESPCVEYEASTGHIEIDPADCGLMWTGGDIVTVSIWGEDTPTACAPNETTYAWSFLVAPGGPQAQIINPQPGWYCACDPQGIEIRLWDEDGVEESTILLVVNGISYTTADPELTYTESDSLLYFEPTPNFPDGQSVNVQLTQADDKLGNPLETPLSWAFVMDIVPPGIDFIEPAVYMTRNREQPVSFILTDNGSGIDATTFGLIIREHGNTHNYIWSDLDWNETSIGTHGEVRRVDVTYNPVAHGVEFTSGDSVNVFVSLCDIPDTCGPNCSSDSMDFMIEPDVECLVFPNPFTPNNSPGINDVAVFNYPFMFSEKAELAIYTIHNVEILSLIHI